MQSKELAILKRRKGKTMITAVKILMENGIKAPSAIISALTDIPIDKWIGEISSFVWRVVIRRIP